MDVSADRVRVSGTFSRGKRGFVLSTKDDALWIIESDEPAEQFVGTDVVVEGTIVGLDRVRADWIGAPSHT